MKRLSMKNRKGNLRAEQQIKEDHKHFAVPPIERWSQIHLPLIWGLPRGHT